MIVTGVCSGDTYKIADLHLEGRHLYATTAHINTLKRFGPDHGEGYAQETDEEDLTLPLDEEQGTVDKAVQGRPERLRKKPAYLKDYNIDLN